MPHRARAWTSAPRQPEARPPESAIDVAVVICTSAEERWDALVAAVESVAAQTSGPSGLVLAVDNNPSLARRSRDRWAEAVVVEHDGPPGVAGARNTGIARTGASEVVAFLDDDAVADPDWLEAMLRAYTDESVMAVGGRIDPIWAAGRPGWFPREFDWVVGCSYLGLPERRSSVRNVIGANMSFRRDVLDALGGFAPGLGRLGSLPVGGDETELCIRARRRWPERTIVYDPAVRVRHQVPEARGRFGYFVSRCYQEGRSKAVVGRLLGGRDPLSSELTHATRVLPAGIARGIRETLSGADRNGVRRAGAIAAGLAAAATGYVEGRARRVTPARSAGG